MCKAIGSFQRWLKRKKGKIPFYRSDSWFKDLLRITGLGIMSFVPSAGSLIAHILYMNVLGEILDFSGLLGGEKMRLAGVLLPRPLVDWIACSGYASLKSHLICLRQAVLSPNSAGRKSRTQAEDKIQSQQNVATAHKQAPLGVSKKERKKNFFSRPVFS